MPGPLKNKAYYVLYKFKNNLLYLGLTNGQPIELAPIKDMRPTSFKPGLILKKIEG